MNQHQEKSFAAKHGPNTRVSKELRAAITKQVSNSEIPCAVAFDIAQQLGATPQETGTAIDMLNFRLIKCQLGLFGYLPDKKIVKPSATIEPQVEALVREALVEDCLSCRKAWEIASRLNRRKLNISSICEALSIKIKPCQLGAF